MGQQRSCGGPSAWSCRNICRVSLTQVQKRTTTSSPQDQKAMSPRMVPYQQKTSIEHSKLTSGFTTQLACNFKTYEFPQEFLGLVARSSLSKVSMIFGLCLQHIGHRPSQHSAGLCRTTTMKSELRTLIEIIVNFIVIFAKEMVLLRASMDISN